MRVLFTGPEIRSLLYAGAPPSCGRAAMKHWRTIGAVFLWAARPRPAPPRLRARSPVGRAASRVRPWPGESQGKKCRPVFGGGDTGPLTDHGRFPWGFGPGSRPAPSPRRRVFPGWRGCSERHLREVGNLGEMSGFEPVAGPEGATHTGRTRGSRPCGLSDNTFGGVTVSTEVTERVVACRGVSTAASKTDEKPIVANNSDYGRMALAA